MLKNSINKLSFINFRKSILYDYKLACISREMSLLGEKEVFRGNAKFGIFGAGKELPQLAMAKIFKNGDFRSGYYRDQTLMLAIGQLTVRNFFSQLYAHNDSKFEPSSGGRMMSCHFATRFLDKKGSYKNLIKNKNSSADLSSTAGNLPRLLGLAQASKIYRNLEYLKKTHNKFSSYGNEIAIGTIGNASTSEGIFWEVINAASVLQVPIILSIFDDGYGISVPNKYQFSKKDFSKILNGFKRNSLEKGVELISVFGWNYKKLIDTYYKAEKIARIEHIPVIIYVKELTQPQGHSTSGSHERYKSKYRINWEKKYDGLNKFKEWILDFKMIKNNNTLKIANIDDIKNIEKYAKLYVSKERNIARELFLNNIKSFKKKAFYFLKKNYDVTKKNTLLKIQIENLASNLEFTKKSVFVALRRSIIFLYKEKFKFKNNFISWYKKKYNKEKNNYSSHLYSNSYKSAINVSEVIPYYNLKKEIYVDGRIIIKKNFNNLLYKYSDLLILGEDVGKIGDVNGTLQGLQKKYGKIRISDTGIREASIIGQGIGLAMRGLKPIVEIQYIDYILYAIYTMSDDLACLRYRTAGGQKAPVIIRTRGHRLEGIWHSGSPMGGILNFLRGILILVPRNMVKAAGFYNTLLSSNEDPALIIECLNGYTLKERLPSNLYNLKTPVGKVEVTRIGFDITIVTYGSTWKIVTKAGELLSKINIEVEIIDIQSLEPFDINHDIVKSLKKTHRLLIVDEDVPGGASAYILKKIIEDQNGYYELDSKPTTITSKAHRPAYGTDGDYFSKPSIEDIIEKTYKIMHESNPKKYSII